MTDDFISSFFDSDVFISRFFDPYFRISLPEPKEESMSNPQIEKLIDGIAHMINGQRIILDDTVRLLDAVTKANTDGAFNQVTAPAILAMLQRSGLTVLDKAGNKIDLNSIKLSPATSADVAAATAPAAQAPTTPPTVPVKQAAGAVMPGTEAMIESLRSPVMPEALQRRMAEQQQAQPAAAPAALPPTVPVEMTPEQKAERESILLTQDQNNLLRVVQQAFSSAISADCRGKLTHRADNKDLFATDIISGESTATIVAYPIGFYVDSNLKTKQFRGESKDGTFVYLLNFGNAAYEKCYIVLKAAADNNIIAPLSSFEQEQRHYFIAAIHEHLKDLVSVA